MRQKTRRKGRGHPEQFLREQRERLQGHGLGNASVPRLRHRSGDARLGVRVAAEGNGLADRILETCGFQKGEQRLGNASGTGGVEGVALADRERGRDRS